MCTRTHRGLYERDEINREERKLLVGRFVAKAILNATEESEGSQFIESGNEAKEGIQGSADGIQCSANEGRPHGPPNRLTCEQSDEMSIMDNSRTTYLIR